MTKQWHNPKIQKKPFTRYNPSLRQNIASVYRPWFLVVAFFSLIIGIALIGCSAALKSYDSNVKDEIFHLWIAIPLVVSGLVALVCFVFKRKNMVTGFLVLILIVAIVCAIGAMVAGLQYWKDKWHIAKRQMDDEKCSLNDKNNCVCDSITEDMMPTLRDDCDDLKTMTRLVISEIGLCAGGFIISILGVYVAFMAICCGPWMYSEWYEEQYDPDFNTKDPVQHVGGNVNPAYGNYK